MADRRPPIISCSHWRQNPHTQALKIGVHSSHGPDPSFYAPPTCSPSIGPFSSPHHSVLSLTPDLRSIRSLGNSSFRLYTPPVGKGRHHHPFTCILGRQSSNACGSQLPDLMSPVANAHPAFLSKTTLLHLLDVCAIIVAVCGSCLTDIP